MLKLLLKDEKFQLLKLQLLLLKRFRVVEIPLVAVG
jgi:hypothetical protein